MKINLSKKMLAMALVIAVSGCGGSDDDDGPAVVDSEGPGTVVMPVSVDPDSETGETTVTQVSSTPGVGSIENLFGQVTFDFNFSGSTQAFTETCLLYTSPSPRDATLSRMPSSA